MMCKLKYITKAALFSGMLLCTSVFATSPVSEEHNLTDEQLDAVMGIITNYILLSDEPKVMTIISPANVTVAENQILAIDVHITGAVGDVSYSISGTDEAYFKIDASTGQITFVEAPDYEIKESYSFTIRVTDSAEHTATQDVTIHISDVDEIPPVFSSSATVTVPENQTDALTIQATDASTPIVYSISGGDSSSFSIDSATGVVTFHTAPDYETKTSYTFTAKATDAQGNIATQDVTITISDIDEIPPVFSSSATVTVAENQTDALTIQATDASTPIVYSISGGDSSSFSIDSATGVVTFNTAPDYETKTSYTFTAKATDANGNEATQDVTITISDIDEIPPVFSSSATVTVAENQTDALTIQATDASTPIVYSISGGDSSSFSIDSATGVVTFNTAPDYETKTSYTFTAKATDAQGNIATQDVTITISDIDEIPPVFSSSATVTVAENQTDALTIQATDASTPIVYSISGGDSSSFSIDSATGVVTFNTVPDYETKTSYTFIAKATDAQGNTATQDVTLTISDVDEIPPVIDIDGEYKVIRLEHNETIDKTIHFNSGAKSVYVIFTNSNDENSSSATVVHNANVVAQNSNVVTNQIVNNQPVIVYDPPYVVEFNKNMKDYLKKSTHALQNIAPLTAVNTNVVGDSETFYLDETTTNTTAATLKKKVENIATSNGDKTLYIWVSDDAFDGDNCIKSKCVTQAMIDGLADKFLKAGLDNDIYDWVTAVYGEEWGDESPYGNTIPESNEITILVTDIENDDSSNGGTVGFFWSKDNFTDIDGSNKRIMFYLDSVMMANKDFGDYWEKELYSTLAHEFQHMIHYYQKRIINGASSDTWLNELCSSVTEDLVATKIETDGVRGVIYSDGTAGDVNNVSGRFPRFNENNMITLTNWDTPDFDTTLAQYSKVASFGTYLDRNYGVGIFHDIVQSSYGDKRAITEAIRVIPGNEQKSFADILREWAVGVVMSDIVTPDNLPLYNAGDFIDKSFNDITYHLGSINFYNYTSQPTFETTISNGAINSNSNYYYKVGDGLTGSVDINITLQDDVNATIIVK